MGNLDIGSQDWPTYWLAVFEWEVGTAAGVYSSRELAEQALLGAFEHYFKHDDPEDYEKGLYRKFEKVLADRNYKALKDLVDDTAAEIVMVIGEVAINRPIDPEEWYDLETPRGDD